MPFFWLFLWRARHLKRRHYRPRLLIPTFPFASAFRCGFRRDHPVHCNTLNRFHGAAGTIPVATVPRLCLAQFNWPELGHTEGLILLAEINGRLLSWMSVHF